MLMSLINYHKKIEVDNVDVITINYHKKIKVDNVDVITINYHKKKSR